MEVLKRSIRRVQCFSLVLPVIPGPYRVGGPGQNRAQRFAQRVGKLSRNRFSPDSSADRFAQLADVATQQRDSGEVVVVLLQVISVPMGSRVHAPALTGLVEHGTGS